MKKRILFAALACLSTTTVFANSSDFYAGTSYLNAQTDLAGESKYNSGYEFHLGYKFNSSFSFEASYLDLGAWGYQDLDTTYSIDTKAVSAVAVYTYAIGNFGLIGRLGYFSQNIDTTAPPSHRYPDSSGGSSIYGLGFSYKLNKKIELNTQWNVTGHTNYGAIGFNYYF